MMRSRLILPVFLLLALVCAAAAPGWAQIVPDTQRGAKRLVLKDGSYQPARSWEVQGDRVRFYSMDRYQWEELPEALVDWEATERWEQEGDAWEAEAQHEQEAEDQRDEARTPVVGEGLRLPEAGGVYLLDEFEGQAQLVELVQSGGKLRAETRGNILRAAINPLARARHSIELKGKRARIQAHPLRPSIYVNLEGVPPAGEGAADSAADAAELQPEPEVGQRYRLVRLDTRRNTRVVGNLRIAMTGRVTEEKTFVESVVEPVSQHWVRVTPLHDLEPGEYALVELLTEQRINLYVWDFGVDPEAPANPATWTPPAPVEIKTGTRESPVLVGKPR
jgi:hypothetical protein